MSGTAAMRKDPAPIRACTVARDVQKFDLLIEDMETELGEAWGDLTFDDARIFLNQSEAAELEFIAVAVDQEDEANLAIVADIIDAAKHAGIQVILIAEGVSPIALHQLLKLGAREFVPYPLPEDALHDAIERLQSPAAANVPAAPGIDMPMPQTGGGKTGDVIAVHGLAGGVGATTLAVNLAWELSNLDKKKTPPRVCLLDFDVQFGTVSTFLDLPRREAVYELLSDTSVMDNDAFLQALSTFQDQLRVLTAPADMLPLDMIAPEDIDRLIDVAIANFDYVVIDMPTAVVHWTETVLNRADVYLAPLELDMRSAQNALRMVRALKSEELPFEKLRFALNRAPKFTDLSGKSRAKRMAESLEISLDIQLPDGGAPVVQSSDHGLPLSETARKNPLRREIEKLAQSIHKHSVEAAAAEV